MSKGLGHIERKVLQQLAKASDHVDAVTLTASVYRVVIPEDPSELDYLPHDRVMTNAQRVAVRRALGNLKRQGLVEEVDGHWAHGSGHWRLAPDILQRLAAGAEPGTSFRRQRASRSRRHDLLAAQLAYLLALPPPQRARRAAELLDAIASHARFLQWEAEHPRANPEPEATAR